MSFVNILDSVFSPLLRLDSFLAVFLMSLLVSVIITLIYKYTTDQNLMKRLKDEMKALQKDMKSLKKEPQKAMEVQKKAMQANMKYMTQSMKSTLYTILPIIIIFGWMNANFAYEPIMPGQDFTVTASFAKGTSGDIEINVPEGMQIGGDAKKSIEGDSAKWVLSGEEGEYLLLFNYEGEQFDKDVLITREQAYKPVAKKIKDDKLKSISIENEKKKILPVVGWGWLGTYIILSIAFSMALRKALKIY
ncbi:DUF106 domain-containing protein [Candidatus Woesearchaeota archaeon]|nr:DUF106 domain-containing protein [Candidatus Woesearchaeota archaeon]